MTERTPAKIPVQTKSTPEQRANASRARKRAEQQALDKADAQRLAQIVNLHIAGMSLADIGASIGASADEVDRMLNKEATRYIRNQPALRVYVRNWISERYAKMIEADWADASNPTSPAKLENQDRVMRMLAQMGRLHGAEAPLQKEITLDAAPEAVEALVNALAAREGAGYDASIFDVVDAEVVHEAAAASEQATYDAGEAVGEGPEEDL